MWALFSALKSIGLLSLLPVNWSSSGSRWIKRWLTTCDMGPKSPLWSVRKGLLVFLMGNFLKWNISVARNRSGIDILTYWTFRAPILSVKDLTCHPLASVKTGNFSSSLVRQGCSGISAGALSLWSTFSTDGISWCQGVAPNSGQVWRFWQWFWRTSPHILSARSSIPISKGGGVVTGTPWDKWSMLKRYSLGRPLPAKSAGKIMLMQLST